jgi:Secretion system C-terminal sorting domain
MNNGVLVTRVWLLCALLLLNNFLFAQKRNGFSHPLRTLANSGKAQSNGVIQRDTVRILAIMVEFQADSDYQTTGNGMFQSNSTSLQLIDPPPHDSLYFKNKIKFVENYFHNVSNGKLTVTGDVYGGSKRITLSKKMSSYSPPTSAINNKNLADLVNESWQSASVLYPEINFQKYGAFVIFHAGVGRDLDLVNSLGYDPTPYDIPSLYLDSTAFALALGQSSFTGFLNGSIKNTIILPETESRILFSSSGNDTVQLSINGMFAASLGNYLGLPDLFNTKTGRSGIGQYGLMDGAAIFAFSGLFPPEPSAWEKIDLGWVTPIIIGNSVLHLQVPAVGIKYPSKQDTIYKIPITASEYFLVENRNRNPKGTGVDIIIADSTSITSRHYDQDISGFNNWDISGIRGSVVDVSNFDWAIVGQTDSTKKYDGGGILIWHIDENVIQAGLSTNSVNINPDHRGIDLEEADGAHDIGQNYEAMTAGSGTENGWPLDCWFAENSAPLYKNIFNQNSFPNSNTFSGAASLISIKDFSTRSPHMTVTVEIGNQIFRRDSSMHRTYNNTSVNSFPTSTKNHLYLPTSNGVFALNTNGQSISGTKADLLSSAPTANGLAVTMLPDSTEIVAGVQDSVLRIYKISFHGGILSIDSSKKYYSDRFTTSPCFAQLDSLSILIGTNSGSLYQLNTNGNIIFKRSGGTDPVLSITVLPTTPAKPNEYFFTSGSRMYNLSSSVDLLASSNGWMLAGAVSPKGNYIISAEKNGSKLISYDQSLSRKNYEITVQGSGITELAIGDIDGDGEKDALVQTTNTLSVVNRLGSMVDGFPIQVRTGLEFTGTPLVLDFNGDGKQEILLLTNDGEMWIYDRNGKLLSGFPVQVTSSGKAFPAAYRSPSLSNNIGIAIFSESATLDAFLSASSTASASLTWWQHLGDERHSNAEASVTTFIPVNTEFFPKSRVYNWPNPVYSQSTQIRYFTSEDAAVTITILDLSGRKITELSGQGTAGMDNEVTWNVSNIQSGVYLARVEARGASRSDVVLIKIAVVK